MTAAFPGAKPHHWKSCENTGWQRIKCFWRKSQNMLTLCFFVISLQRRQATVKCVTAKCELIFKQSTKRQKDNSPWAVHWRYCYTLWFGKNRWLRNGVQCTKGNRRLTSIHTMHSTLTLSRTRKLLISYTRWSKNRAQFLYALTLWNINNRFSKLLHCQNQKKSVIILSLKIPPHFTCVATLPREMLSALKAN